MGAAGWGGPNLRHDPDMEGTAQSILAAQRLRSRFAVWVWFIHTKCWFTVSEAATGLPHNYMHGSCCGRTAGTARTPRHILSWCLAGPLPRGSPHASHQRTHSRTLHPQSAPQLHSWQACPCLQTSGQGQHCWAPLMLHHSSCGLAKCCWCQQGACLGCWLLHSKAAGICSESRSCRWQWS